MNGEVLVLNNNYQPLNVTNIRRAVTLLYLGKAEVMHTDTGVFRSEKRVMEVPTVVRLGHFVRRPMPALNVSRKSIFARDRHACQYCGSTNLPLTVDHVIPKDQGGRTDWDNLVTCCTKCNNKKGNRTPQKAGMSLLHKATRPKFIPYISYTKFLEALSNPHWRIYLEPYANGNE